MKPQFECEMNYFNSVHLSQIYSGFAKLEKLGIVKLKVKHISSNQTKPILKVKINKKYNVIYDTLDGFNWIDGSEEENLNYFKNNIIADFYFKRSFNQRIIEFAPKDCRVFPLGLNYPMKTPRKFSRGIKSSFKYFLRENYLISKYYSKTFSSQDFEFFPFPLKDNKILFIARLWNPDNALDDNLRAEREKINLTRIRHIKICRKELGENFVGGIQHDEFSMRNAKDLLLPFSLTRRENFLKTMRNCNVCIATTGLHNSIGWKFGEYVAASRAIVSEPINFQLPGNFSEEKNFLTFKDETDLINTIFKLLNDRDKLYSIMKSNFHYYNNYLQPDKLILNTLSKIYFL